MQKGTLTKSILACALVAACNLSAQGNGADSAQQQKIIRVSTLNSIQANQEFQRNVQIMQNQRQQVIDLNEKLKGTNNANEKAQIQKDLDETLKKLNENNQIMFKTYGFSLTRNYTLVVEKAHVYMFVSDEEAKKFEEAQAKENK